MERENKEISKTLSDAPIGTVLRVEVDSMSFEGRVLSKIYYLRVSREVYFEGGWRVFLQSRPNGWARWTLVHPGYSTEFKVKEVTTPFYT